LAAERPGYVTKELAAETLKDFEELFERRPAPGAFRCWCMYHQEAKPGEADLEHPRGNQTVGNRERRRDLVKKGRSHGIVVYWEGRPVGWCQFGLMDELPRFDGIRGYRRPDSEGGRRQLWRITCFTVDRRYRERRIASAGLAAALDSIRTMGGGIVEAYPIVRWGAYREYLGTASMFRKKGFDVVGKFGRNNVVMRRTL